MLSKRDLQLDLMQLLCSSLIKRCKATGHSMGNTFFLHRRPLKLGGQRYWGHYEGCSSAPLPLPGGAIWFLPVFPTTLQLILPFAWAAHMAAISYFLTVLHSLFISIHLCVIPCMSEIFLQSHYYSCCPDFPSDFLADWIFPLLR